MLESRARHLQYLAAQRFYEEASGDFTFFQEDPSYFTEEELLEEAAFRCWLREIDPHDCPSTLPSSATLRAMADSFDWEYGEFAWWTWPIWSSCEEHCHSEETPVLCADRSSYTRYCAMSEGWAGAFNGTAGRLCN